MESPMHLLTIGFSPSDDADNPTSYRLRLDSAAVGNASVGFGSTLCSACGEINHLSVLHAILLISQSNPSRRRFGRAIRPFGNACDPWGAG